MNKFKKGDVVVRTGENVPALGMFKGKKYVVKDVFPWDIAVEGKACKYCIDKFELAEENQGRFKVGDKVVRVEGVEVGGTLFGEAFEVSSIAGDYFIVKGGVILLYAPHFELAEPEYKVFKELTDEEKLELINLSISGVRLEQKRADKVDSTWKNKSKYTGAVNFKANYLYRVKDLEPIKKELEEINTQIQELLDKADMLSKKL